jgi:hypothetical protein
MVAAAPSAAQSVEQVEKVQDLVAPLPPRNNNSVDTVKSSTLESLAETHDSFLCIRTKNDM